MTEKEKELLKYLCTRLAYKEGLKCAVGHQIVDFQMDLLPYFKHLKPYLRPMSSMTEDEKEELGEKYVLSSLSFEVYKIHQHKEWYGGDDEECTFSDYLWLIDWLNEHNFDYRGLIKKGLALEAPNDMYKVSNE